VTAQEEAVPRKDERYWHSDPGDTLAMKKPPGPMERAAFQERNPQPLFGSLGLFFVLTLLTPLFLLLAAVFVSLVLTLILVGLLFVRLVLRFLGHGVSPVGMKQSLAEQSRFMLATLRTAIRSRLVNKSIVDP
jgi:hypothetical protein